MSESKLLYRELVKTEMSCVPVGRHHITKIYEFVKEGYPELCDDSIECKMATSSSRGNTKSAM